MPISQYRRRARGSDVRQRQCNACHAAKERARRRRRRHKLVGRELGRYSRKLAEARNEVQLVRVVDQMIGRFGGIERLAKTWCFHLEAAGRDRPGCKRVFDFFRGFGQMLKNHEERQEREYQRMSTDDLDAVVIQNMQEFLSANPEFTIKVAQSIGWKVEPQ